MSLFTSVPCCHHTQCVRYPWDQFLQQLVVASYLGDQTHAVSLKFCYVAYQMNFHTSLLPGVLNRSYCVPFCYTAIWPLLQFCCDAGYCPFRFNFVLGVNPVSWWSEVLTWEYILTVTWSQCGATVEETVICRLNCTCLTESGLIEVLCSNRTWMSTSSLTMKVSNLSSVTTMAVIDRFLTKSGNYIALKSIEGNQLLLCRLLEISWESRPENPLRIQENWSGALTDKSNLWCWLVCTVVTVPSIESSSDLSFLRTP